MPPAWIHMRSLFLVVALSACGGASSTPNGPRTAADILLTDDDEPYPAEAATPGFGLHPGEAMTFQVSVAGMEAGEAALAVGELGEVDGQQAIVVTSKVSSAGAFRWIKEVDDLLTTTIDVETGLPITHTADTKFGAKTYHADNTFDGPRVDLVWHRNDGNVRNTHYDFRDVIAHDAHTAMASLRNWQGADGEVRRLYLVGGRRIWQTDVTWAGRETIASELGNQTAIRLDGISTRVTPRLKVHDNKKPPRTFTVWLTDDGDRAPIRVVAHTELGDIVIELTSYSRP